VRGCTLVAELASKTRGSSRNAPGIDGFGFLVHVTGTSELCACVLQVVNPSPVEILGHTPCHSQIAIDVPSQGRGISDHERQVARFQGTASASYLKRTRAETMWFRRGLRYKNRDLLSDKNTDQAARSLSAQPQGKGNDTLRMSHRKGYGVGASEAAIDAAIPRRPPTADFLGVTGCGGIPRLQDATFASRTQTKLSRPCARNDMPCGRDETADPSLPFASLRVNARDDSVAVAEGFPDCVRSAKPGRSANDALRSLRSLRLRSGQAP